jgi:flagellar hook-basal body complex protein FliE
MPIDPTFALTGPEWQIGGISPIEPGQNGAVDGAAAGSGGFGSVLGSSLQSLAKTQEDAATASRDLATGQATDPTAVVMAVERAQLAMQLASSIRTKAVEAAQDIFHTPV